MKNSKEKFDPYQEITDRFIEMLSNGIIPWRRSSDNALTGAVSFVTGKPYSLLNQMIIGRSGEFITFNKAKELGGRLRTGSHGHRIWMWTWREKIEEQEDGTEKKVSYPVLKFYYVFDVRDFDGLDATKKGKATVKETAAEDAVCAYLARENGLKLRTSSIGEASYSPAEDLALVPAMASFPGRNAYYATVFHELTHSTMKETRCDRMKENGGRTCFSSGDFSREELTAELGSSLLLDACGLEVPAMAPAEKNDYAAGWLYQLRADKKLIVTAAARAEKAVKYILTGKKPEENAA